MNDFEFWTTTYADQVLRTEEALIECEIWRIAFAYMCGITYYLRCKDKGDAAADHHRDEALNDAFKFISRNYEGKDDPYHSRMLAHVEHIRKRIMAKEAS